MLTTWYMQTDPVNEIYTNEALDEWNLMVNVAHNMLICNTCQCFVNGTGVQHIQGHWKYSAHSDSDRKPSTEDYLKMGLTHLNVRAQPPPIPSQRGPPFVGLAVLEGYFACPHCNRAFGKAFSTACKGCKKAVQVGIRTKAQRFIRSGNLFGVLDVVEEKAEELLEESFWSVYQQSSHTEVTPAQENALHDQERILRRYLSDMGWLAFFETHQLSTIDLVKMHTNEPEEGALRNYLRRSITDMLSEMQVNLQPDQNLRHAIGKRPASQHSELEHRNHRMVQVQTLERYGSIIVKLIIFMKRALDGSYPMNVPEQVKELVRRVTCLSPEQQEEYESELTAEEEEAQEQGDIQNLDEYGEAMAEPEDGHGSNTHSQGLLTLSETQKNIRDILSMLMQDVPKDARSALFHSPILHFIGL